MCHSKLSHLLMMILSKGWAGVDGLWASQVALASQAPKVASKVASQVLSISSLQESLPARPSKEIESLDKHRFAQRHFRCCSVLVKESIVGMVMVMVGMTMMVMVMVGMILMVMVLVVVLNP